MGELMAPEYRSPFLLPECTSPADAEKYPIAHTHPRNKCPVHKRDQGKNESNPWLIWWAYREAYATVDGEGKEFDSLRGMLMEKMLGTVTRDNPPEAPAEPWVFLPDIWMKTEP